jgi:hypothetical protein
MQRTLTRFAVVVVALAALLAGGVVTAQPAQASSVVYVDMRVPGTWWGATQYGVTYTDRYTSSHVVWAPCPYNGSRCVVIRPLYLPGMVALTDWTHDPVIYTWVDPYDQWRYPFSVLANVAAHEYAHAMRVRWHSSYCNIMFYRTYCYDGRWRPWTFTWDQRSVLARN